MSSKQSYPLPAYLKFCPGGITYQGGTPQDYHLLVESKDALISQAKQADDRLRQYAQLVDPNSPHALPSLSVLAEHVFGRLTGCPANHVKAWADAMVLQYKTEPPTAASEDDIWNGKPSASATTNTTAAAWLRSIQSDEVTGPCGYVFKRGDIAWNCRTCQADATCVVCDSCFRQSDHTGHEVYFHRTTPGGCCDCGDAEAWAVAGCCDKHRPAQVPAPSDPNDPMEAVRLAQKGLQEGEELARTKLPPRVAAALGVVVGAAVQAIVQAVDGAGIASDPVQWKRRWAEEAAHVANGTATLEDYYGMARAAPVMPSAFWTGASFPDSYQVQLRLHNDDVHTFDEVIEALHGDPRMRHHRHLDAEASLVPLRENATEMTHHVDSDGQVTVRAYNSLNGAMTGFQRLKSSGLHCAVVSVAQIQLELRARALISWLSDLSAAHPAAAALVVHAWVQVEASHDLGGVQVWPQARTIPPWVALGETDKISACRRRFQAFPPHLLSSFVTREEARLLHGLALDINPSGLLELTGTDPNFYANVPFQLPSERYRKSPHALWGCLPSSYADKVPPSGRHPLLQRLVTPKADATATPNTLSETVFVVDTDLRKQQNPKVLTSSLFPHKLPGLNMVSGVGTVKLQDEQLQQRNTLPNSMHWRHLLAISSFRAPMSPILLVLLLDPYPTKQVRGALHVLFLSLLTDSRFKSRFSGALGVAYRPLSTLFCAGVGTEADTPLHFSVQILTAGSLVRALTHRPASELLVRSDRPGTHEEEATIGIFVPPIAHVIVRCVHTNLLGATQEVNMILKNTTSGNDDTSADESSAGNDKLLPALTYVAGEHPLLTPLPAAPDDGFLDSRSTRHKRLPHLLRDLEYVIETPGTAMRLLLPNQYPVYQGPSLSMRGEDVLSFSSVFARMLRLAQGMDTQKRKISGGHVEYEHNRWLEAFGLSLVLAGARDALAESPNGAPVLEDGSHLVAVREATGNFVAALLREMKLWLYRENLLETGLPVPTPHGVDVAQVTSLQRSTLHVSSSQYSSSESSSLAEAGVNMVALSCATGVKMTEAQLTLIENAMKVEASMRQTNSEIQGPPAPPTGPLIGDWLRVPHSPLGGDSLSFHLPLHRALAKCVRSICAVVVPLSYRTENPSTWWKLPVLDDHQANGPVDSSSLPHHPLVPLVRSTLRSSNCRVNWSAGPDCTPPEAQKRRSRSRAVSANIAIAKVLHSFADHPLRSLAAAQQIERHLWARNGTSVAGMAMNYSNTPLCRSFRDLDLLLVQLSAAGMSCGLGARRVFSLILSRFGMDGYLCDPERRVSSASPGTSGSFGPPSMTWVKPPRLQDPDHAVILAESFFATICVLVTELPPPPPTSMTDDSSLRQSIRRELLHALLAEPRSHSEAMAAASSGISRREESDGNANNGSGASMFTEAFTGVLNEIGKQKTRSASRASSGPPAFELKPEFCEEYDPAYFHLKRIEHQHAMDIVARLRKLKLGNDKAAIDAICLPLVCPPPKAHPRFLPCRLLLHLNFMDAAIRRSLLFALTNGSWLPPGEPACGNDSQANSRSESTEMAAVAMAEGAVPDVPMAAFSRRLLKSQGSGSFAKREDQPTPFSKEVVAASSVSFLEVLQLLTLQIHTLEECASLHRFLPDLDDESRLLSSGLSINSYLRRLTEVPESLVGVWALQPYPEGPLQSKGSGENRGSILGLLIALYEHRSDHGAILDSDGGDQGDEGHGGARALASSGLKWILRFINALVDGAQSVGAAMKSAATGIRIRRAASRPVTMTVADSVSSSWTIDADVKAFVSGMLADLPDLWPVAHGKSVSPEKAATKGSEAGKAAQKRQMEIMRRMQAKFAATIKQPDASKEKEEDTESKDLCIICRCDDADGENNGPLGYLGHVQRSRVTQMRGVLEAQSRKDIPLQLSESYRVVGHMGCQLRETEAMDSKALTCLPKGSVVTVVNSRVSPELGIRSRRVLVRHIVKGSDTVTEGWASVQSSQGYVILSPLLSLCFTNSRWGSTRPVIKQCGHAAHLRCVETHTLSLHHRAASEQTYDGRFAANIDDGEFLCPLCKQLSNILIPRSNLSQSTSSTMDIEDGAKSQAKRANRLLRDMLITACAGTSGSDGRASMAGKALEQYGTKLYSAMSVPWERATGSQRKHQLQWNPAIQKWDYEDEDGSTKDMLRLLRQQLIAWSAVGHSAAALEASSRSVEEVLPFGVFAQTVDPWSNFDVNSKDSHPMLLELKRSLSGSSGLLRLICDDITGESRSDADNKKAAFIGVCLADILEGRSWAQRSPSGTTGQSKDSYSALWGALSALISATPCHVARDGTIPQRCEARATAAAMWAVKGLGTDSSESNEVPAPFSIQQLPDSLRLDFGWGSLDPIVNASIDSPTSPFRPGIASAFLHLPLLSWDLCTLSAAAFSVALAGTDPPSSEEVIALAKLLLAGRVIQAIVTPCGFDEPEEMELDEEDCWSPEEIEEQGSAIVTLVAHCREVVKSRTIHGVTNALGVREGLRKATLLAGIGRAILPFSRALVLMLRACAAATRERQPDGVEQSRDDKILEDLTCRKDLMTLEDGFHFFKAINGPLPTEFIDISGDLWALTNRWLGSAVVLELQNNSSGRFLAQPVQLDNAKSAPHQSLEADSRAVDMDTNASDTEDDTERIRMEMNAGGAIARPAIDEDDEEEYDDEMMQDVDMADVEELSQDQVMGIPSLMQPSAAGNGDGEESSEDYSSSDAEGEDGDREFAHVSKSPILYYQPSLLGLQLVGPGTTGATFDYATASGVMSDLSHLGLVHQRSTPMFSLVRLPKSFVELYNMVNKVKGRDETSALDENDDASNSETAICLLTGAVMRSGSARRPFSRGARQPGSCTMHARKTGSGIGIFFLVQKCTVLLMHNNKSAYSPSLYVDMHGEEDPGLKRGRPLFLNEDRYRALELSWRQQGIPGEVAQIRSTSDRVIRDNWY